jgi:hypothetical protein
MVAQFTSRHTAMTISPLSRSTLETITSLSEGFAVVLTALGAIAGLIFVLASRPLRKMEAKEMLSLRAETARALDSAEKEKLERVKLEGQLAPRRVTSAQREQLIAALRGTHGGAAVVSSFFDPEATDFANDLDAAIRAAGWETARIKSLASPKRSATGLDVALFVGSAPLPTIPVLHNALMAAGINNEEAIIERDEENRVSPSFETGYLYLVVRKKPEPTHTQ